MDAPARFSFADNDLLVSSSASFGRSARSDTSTRFEAGKQAGPDTIEHFLGGGAEGHTAMENWLKGGFEMDRRGDWRLKPQVADTLQRDVQAIIAQTGWQRSLSRGSSHQLSQAISVDGEIGASIDKGGGRPGSRGRTVGRLGGRVGMASSDIGQASTDARASIDIMNYDVRTTIAAAELVASRSRKPEIAFTDELSRQILGNDGLRNRYLGQAAAGRGTADATAPITSWEQSKILDSGRFSGDRDEGLGDGDPKFRPR
ncbi:MAG: hypothetical protein DI547_17230 [Sphingobium sp.]|nr:MAG: hypothetical protein DI547_17230 [Sphingobium sp.]